MRSSRAAEAELVSICSSAVRIGGERGKNMGRGRQWQGWEVFLLREAARENRRRGLKYSVGEYAGRLKDVAKRTGRSYAAVRKMAHDIHARSFRPRRR